MNNFFIIFRGHSTTTRTKFCHFFTPPASTVFYTLSVDKNRHFLTPSPLHLVHVVIEWSLILSGNDSDFFNISAWNSDKKPFSIRIIFTN